MRREKFPRAGSLAARVLGFGVGFFAVSSLGCSGEVRPEELLPATLRLSADACFQVEAEFILSPGVELAYDVRWAGPGEILLSRPLKGVYRAKLSEEGGFSLGAVEVLNGRALDQIYIPVYLGISDSHWAVGGPVYMVGWRSWQDSNQEIEVFDRVIDLDVYEDRLLVLGVRRGVDNSFAPDGAIAYIGSMSKELADFEPFIYSAFGPGAAGVDSCGMIDLGSTRFLADGSAVVIPGVEEGVFLYGPDGSLRRTWQAAEVGFDAGCAFSKKDVFRYSVDEIGRREWVNQRRVVDEILPLPEGPGLILRSVKDGVTHWQMAILGEEGIRRCDLPFTGGAMSRLHADIQDGQVVFLIYTDVLPKDRSDEEDWGPKLLLARVLEQ